MPLQEGKLQKIGFFTSPQCEGKREILLTWGEGVIQRHNMHCKLIYSAVKQKKYMLLTQSKHVSRATQLRLNSFLNVDGMLNGTEPQLVE